MSRFIFILVFVFSFSVAFSQDYVDDDTSFYTPMFERDTNARVHVGVKVGTLVRGLVYQSNPDPQYSDSINSWSSENKMGFVFGLVMDARLSPHWNLESGFDIVVSKIEMSAYFQSTQIVGITNYTSFKIPAWFNYAPKVKSNRMFFGGGAIFSMDISRRTDKYNRLIQFNNVNLMLGLGFGYRMQLPSKSNLNFDVQLQYGLRNLVSDDDNFYNNAMNSINIWELIFCIWLN